MYASAYVFVAAYVPQAAALAPDLTTGVEFDGTNDYLTRGADLTGSADGKVGTLSLWFKNTQSAGTGTIFESASNTVSVGMSGGSFRIILRSGVGQTLFFRSVGGFDDGVWHHAVASWDLANEVGSLYIDDELQGATTATNNTVDQTQTDWAVGALTAGTSKYDGCLAELYWAQEYVGALSTEANRRKFIDANGEPVSLGSDGSTPTGNQPILYLSGGADQFAHNFGSGGEFTVAGAFEDCPIELFETITATLSIGAAIQAQRTLAASLSGAIQQQRSITAGVDAAIAQALTALTSASAAIATTNTATFSLDAALQEAKSATADANAVIQAVQTASASLQGAIQTGQSSSVQVGAAVQALMDAQAAVDAVIQATMTASVGLSANIDEEGVNLATAVLSGAIQALQSASAGLTGAIQGAGSAQVSVSAAIAAVRSVTATIDAVIAQVVMATPSVDGAILASMSATASLDARIFALGEFTPSLSRMHTAGRQSRTHVVPARTRRH